MKEVKIVTEYILLGQLLKLTGIISNGSDAKWFLNDNKVEINGVIDQRRGKKLYPGDKVEVLNQTFIIVGATE